MLVILLLTPTFIFSSLELHIPTYLLSISISMTKQPYTCFTFGLPHLSQWKRHLFHDSGQTLFAHLAWAHSCSSGDWQVWRLQLGWLVSATRGPVSYSMLFYMVVWWKQESKRKLHGLLRPRLPRILTTLLQLLLIKAGYKGSSDSRGWRNRLSLYEGSSKVTLKKGTYRNWKEFGAIAF